MAYFSKSCYKNITNLCNNIMSLRYLTTRINCQVGPLLTCITGRSVHLQPFHLAIPVHDLQKAKYFYGRVMGFSEGRSSTSWQDYNMFGHQLVVHEVGSDYKAKDWYNPVDQDDVPVPHFGVALTVNEFHELSNRLQNNDSDPVKFVIEPHLRFQGLPGEQWTMFFRDPSGNSLEFKAMTNADNLFQK